MSVGKVADLFGCSNFTFPDSRNKTKFALIIAAIVLTVILVILISILIGYETYRSKYQADSSGKAPNRFLSGSHSLDPTLRTEQSATLPSVDNSSPIEPEPTFEFQ